jgi:hypothetical protein
MGKGYISLTVVDALLTLSTLYGLGCEIDFKPK